MKLKSEYKILRELINQEGASGRLTLRNSQIAEIRPETTTVISIIFLLGGLGLLIFAGYESRLLFLTKSKITLPLGFEIVDKGFDVIFICMISLVGIILFIFGLVLFPLWGWRRKIIIDRSIKMIQLMPHGKELGSTISFRNISALQLLLGTGQQKGWELNLVLSQPSGKRISLLRNTNEEQIRSDASELASFMNVPILDHTKEEFRIGENKIINIEKTFIQSASSNFRTMALNDLGAGQMIFKPLLGSKLFNLCFTFFGSFGIFFAALFLFAFLRTFDWASLIGVLIGGVVGTVFIVVSRKIKEYPIIFDRIHGVVRGKLFKRIDGFSDEIPLRNIKALQICSETIHGGDNIYDAFQLNIVLENPAGKRIPIICHAKEKAIRDDARILSEFLGVPLLDHS